MSTLLITGAGGFIGRHLCSVALQRGHTVRGAVRQVSAQGRPADWPDAPAQVRWIACGDVGAGTDWRAAVTGADAVVHLAGWAHALRVAGADGEAISHRVNVEGTRRLAEAALEAGVGRFVFVSSIHVHGDLSSGGAIDEAAPIRPHNAYARSKWQAEQTLTALRGRGLQDVVVRPCLVSGAGAKGNLQRLLGGIARGWPLPLGAVRNVRSFVGVANLCDLLLHCMTEARAVHEAFLAADEPPLSTAELVQALAAAMGRPARLIPVPPALLGAALTLAGRGQTWRQLGGSLVANGAKSRAFFPRTDAQPIHDSLAEMARAYLAGRRGR